MKDILLDRCTPIAVDVGRGIVGMVGLAVDPNHGWKFEVKDCKVDVSSNSDQ